MLERRCRCPRLRLLSSEIREVLWTETCSAPLLLLCELGWLLGEFSRPIWCRSSASIHELLLSPHLLEVDCFAGHLRPSVCEVLERRIFGDALLGSEAVELLWLAGCETVALEGHVCACLFLELGEGVGARGALGAA